MNPNPYQSPYSNQEAPAAAVNRTPFILAAVGAGLASLYWAGLTLLILVGVGSGAVSGFQVILPIVLIVLYAMRAFQLLKGQTSAAKNLLWLHGVGGVFAVIAMASGNPITLVLQGIKVAIHIFGAITAYMAFRAAPA